MVARELLQGSLTGNVVANILLACIGSLFLFKYSARVSEYPFLIAAAYFVGYAATAHMLWNRRTAAGRNDRMLSILAGMVVVLIGIVIVTTVPEGSRVGRLPALIEVIERYLAGEFPWAESALTRPSGFPALFVFALPFYYAGNPGFLEVAGLLLFVSSLFIAHRDKANVGRCLLTLLILPTFYYELVVRSELFFNMAIFLFLLVLAERHLDVTRLDLRFISFAILFGICVCTRLVLVMTFAAYFTYRFRQDLVHGLMFGFLTLAAFCLCILPFLLWDPQAFLLHGPFSIQMSYLPTGVAAVFLFAACLIGWNCAVRRIWFLSVGILLFVLVLVSFLLASNGSTYAQVVLNDGFDISYVIFSVPFLLLSLENRSISGNSVVVSRDAGNPGKNPRA